MRKIELVWAIILSVATAGCVGGNKAPANELITVDVNASYPTKELTLQSFMEVEYIPLETTDEFITRGSVKAIGKSMLLVTNQGTNGDIFIYTREGKALRKVNRLGQSGEEYSQITFITLDEDNNEMFITDYPGRKVIVYDLMGNFRRSFSFSDTSYYNFIANYDGDNLICYKGYSPTMETEESYHLLISKKDGSITRKIQIPFEKTQTPVWTKEGATITPGFSRTIPTQAGWTLLRGSSDTIYNYLPDQTMLPIIARTPSIHSMEPQVFLYPTAMTDRYYFMRALTKEFDLEKMKGFSTRELMYDKQEKAIFEYTLYNDDFVDKREVSWPSENSNSSIAAFWPLQAPNLVEAYEEGKLKGKLKEIASELNEESNPVIMLVKYRKQETENI
ncbi:6-bladed beta-propeller [Bacteroides sp.]|uniref:6-bladed beta-propeller n=1 Tax=Bacteroides sp. TaxID=29523 RepID=UPI002FC61329